MVKLVITRMLLLAGILALLCTLVNASTSSSHLHHDQGSSLLLFCQFSFVIHFFLSNFTYSNYWIDYVLLNFKGKKKLTFFYIEMKLIIWQVYRRNYRRWRVATSSISQWSRSRHVAGLVQPKRLYYPSNRPSLWNITVSPCTSIVVLNEVRKHVIQS
jgi:hypothetical protein